MPACLHCSLYICKWSLFLSLALSLTQMCDNIAWTLSAKKTRKYCNCKLKLRLSQIGWSRVAFATDPHHILSWFRIGYSSVFSDYFANLKISRVFEQTVCLPPIEFDTISKERDQQKSPPDPITECSLYALCSELVVCLIDLIVWVDGLCAGHDATIYLPVDVSLKTRLSSTWLICVFWLSSTSLLSTQ